jgi:hypothetical protein
MSYSSSNYQGLNPKTEYAAMLFQHVVAALQQIGPTKLVPHKTMLSFLHKDKHVAYVTQFGKDFVHMVLPFKRRYDANDCFQRIQQVPGRKVIYHHLRIYQKDDINEEVMRFLRIVYADN